MAFGGTVPRRMPEGVQAEVRMDPGSARSGLDRQGPYPPPPSHLALTAGVELLALAGVSFLAGVAGSFLGIGGGIFLVPFLTLALHLDPRVAVATSLVGVIATSSGAASVYVRDRLTNLRLGMFLEVATTIGAILGALVAIYIDPRALFLVFAVVVLSAAAYMARTGETARDRAYQGATARAAESLRLDSLYFDPEDRGVYRYRVARPVAGFAASAFAGGLSGLLGVGGGFVKVPVMNVLMRVPLKAAIATSNFMIGVTAAASAFLYYAHGFLDPVLAAVVVLGVLGGTVAGTRLMVRTRSQRIRLAFAAVLVILGVLMGLRAFGVAVVP